MATAPRAEAKRTGGLLRADNLPVILTIAAMVVGIAALIPLVQSSASTSTAGDIRRLEQEKIAWRTQLQELELEIARMGSLDWIETQARLRFKMRPPDDSIYIHVDSPPPEARKLPARYLPQESAGAIEEGSSVWEQMFGWMPTPWD